MYEHGTCASSSPRQSGPRAAADRIPPNFLLPFPIHFSPIPAILLLTLTLVANPLELQKATFSTARPDRLNKFWRISSLEYSFDNFLRIFFRKVPNNPIIQISNYLKKFGLYPLLV